MSVTPHLRRLLLKLSLGFCVSNANARIICKPSQANWQLSPQRVAQGALKKYQDKVTELQQGQLLDTDTRFTQGLHHIMTRLAAQAGLDYPDSREWHWEIHSSDQVDESSYSMAGGKIIISRPQVHQLSLNETALAMLIAHEMAHALLLHNFIEDQEALRLYPAWLDKPFEEFETAIDDDETLLTALAPLGKQQEFEADLKGFQLAMRAGYSARGLLRFFEQLRRHSHFPNFESRSHPAAAKRLQRLRDWLATT